ncbi:MAG: PKD domain-containing protein, partial [Bacteroidota bacterium]
MKKALFKTLPLLMLGLIWVAGCKKKTPEVISGFTFTVDAVDFKKVTFTNASQNYSSVSWDFGDGSTSSELNPVHSYAAVGNY